MTRILALVSITGLLAAGTVAAQEPARRLFLEARAGVVVPTFDIADVATTGTAFGGTVGYRMNRWVLMGEFDYGMHQDEPTETVDISTLHFVAKLGYAVVPATDRGLEVILNLGAGFVRFGVDGGESFTYPAINAGAKIAYNLGPSFALVFSPQGDIAISSEDEVGSSTAWVWPVTAGLRVRF